MQLANRFTAIVASLAVMLCAGEVHFNPWLAFGTTLAVISALQTE
jgi:hypothetical protein